MNIFDFISACPYPSSCCPPPLMKWMDENKQRMEQRARGIFLQNTIKANENRVKQTHRKPCSCSLRYAEWSKKSFNCGISIFCPLTLTPPPDDLTKLLLLVRCLFVDFTWCVLLLLFDKLWLFVELFVTIVELLVRDSDTSRLGNNDLLVNDNFSVVSSGELLGELSVACISSVTVIVVNVGFSSDKTSAVVVVKLTSVVAMRPELFVVLCNEEILESGKAETDLKNSDYLG